MVQIGLIPGEVPTEGNAPTLPPAALASEQARKAQQAYDSTRELMGEDHPSTKYLREQLEKEMAKAGPTAQLRNRKQLSDHKLAVSKHGDDAKKDQDRIRAVEQQRVEALEQELAKQKAYQVQMEATFKAHNDLTAQALQRLIDMETQVKALEDAAMAPAADTGPQVVAAQPSTPPAADILQSLQTFIAAIQTIPDFPEAAQEPLKHLQSTMEVHLKPPAGTGPPPPPTPTNAYGKASASTTSTLTRAEADPYGIGAKALSPGERQDEQDANT